MKKIFCLMTALMLIVFGGCSNKDMAYEDHLPTVLDQYLENVESFETPTREYGTSERYVQIDEKLMIGILYPNCEIPELDLAIEEWITQTVSEYQTEADSVEDTEGAAELTVDYESFLINGSQLSIKLRGSFIAPYMAHPTDIIKTFNANIDDGRLLSITDVLTQDMLQTAKDKITSTANVITADIDQHFFDNWSLTDSGVEIILERGRYLPMSDGTKVFSFEWSELEVESTSEEATLEETTEKATEDIPVFEETPTEKTSTEEAVTEESASEEITTEDTEQEISDTESETDTESEREEIASDETQIAHIDPDKPMIALTFDDGPSAHTERLLDIFKEHGGSGTFFVVGNMISGKEDTLRRIVDDGHEIGNHSWNHRQFTNLSEEELTDQIMMTRAKIYDTIGKDCLIVRPPYGACNDDVKAVGAKLGVHFVNWSVDTLDWKSRDAQAVYDETMKYVKDGAIVLYHDLHKSTVDAMETIIPKLIEDGYQLVTVSQLFEFSDKTIEAGKMYYNQ